MRFQLVLYVFVELVILPLHTSTVDFRSNNQDEYFLALSLVCFCSVLLCQHRTFAVRITVQVLQHLSFLNREFSPVHLRIHL